jgi:hypothetical protein
MDDTPMRNVSRRIVLGSALALGASGAGLVRPAYAAPGETGPEIAACADWGAREPKGEVQMLEWRPEKIIVHHTATANTDDYSLDRAYTLARAMQKNQMDVRGWLDTGQHFTISRGAYVMEGRHESLTALRRGSRMVEGAHCSGQNSLAIGIENEGTYTEEEPPAEQYAVLVELCVYICAQYGVAAQEIYGHRDYNNTQCPGDQLYALLPKLRGDVADQTGSSTGLRRLLD